MARHTSATTGTGVPARTNNHYRHYAAIFATLFVLGAVTLGLTAHIVHLIRNNELAGGIGSAGTGRFKYNLFAAVWTTLMALVWLGIVVARSLFKWMHHTIFLVITAIIWLIAAALIEDRVGDGRYCSTWNGPGYCKEIRAIRVLNWVLFGLSLASIPYVLKQRKHERRAALVDNHATDMRTAPAGTTHV